MISPTIDEVTLKKETLRLALLEQIKEFETETGVMVDAISIDHTEVTSFGDKKTAFALGDVRITLKLP